MVKKLVYIGATLLFAVIAVAVGLFVHSAGAAFRGASFDRQVWSTVDRCGPEGSVGCSIQQKRCPRGGMVQDLRRHYLDVGDTTKSDVTQIIGLPDTQISVRTQRCDAYDLGMCSAMSLDGDSLYLCYDAAGTLLKTGVIRH